MDRHSEKKKVDILEAMLKLFTKKNKKTLHVPEVRLELYYTEDAQDFRYDTWKNYRQCHQSISGLLDIYSF